LAVTDLQINDDSVAPPTRAHQSVLLRHLHLKYHLNFALGATAMRMLLDQ
jgi:hypothetical protein